MTYGDAIAFHSWCKQANPICRMNGKLSLLGLPPLVKAEIQWTMFRHTQGPDQGAHWPIPWIQYVADDCRDQGVHSLADLDLDKISQRRRQVATAMMVYLRPVYYTRQDAKDAASSRPTTTASASPAAPATSI